MRKIKKSLLGSLLGVCCLLSMLVSPSFAYASKVDTTAKVLKDFKVPNVINQYMNAINNKDWNSFVKSYSPDRQKNYDNFPGEYQIENRTGILSVDSIQIYEAKQIPSENIMQIEPYFKEINNSLYNNIRY